MPRGVYERKPQKRKPYKRKPVEERFWAKVKKDTESGCLEWTGTLNELGYGRFKINGKLILAHRFSYELHKGPIADGMYCLHSCDNRRCCNPNHLSVGSHLENYHDMLNKNRQHYKNILNSEKVKNIKIRLQSGEFYKNIAKEFDMPSVTVYHIKTGKTWAHVKIN
jgi:hypothetical protein